ncbi:MAG: adenylosuccinate lyase [Dehalococcoidia bacterium]|nr:adenylosuccinate lyase [Dehalococcoidia bacterium]MDH4367776.1 adenylosuccinate lyase [Dehalococcoidia bacterium]
MIERYSRPEMKEVWSEENKFDLWLKVEIAVCEAWAELGEIPRKDMVKIKQARYNLDRIAKFLKVTHHDMTAFLKSVAESLGTESRFVHLGLTSSDVMDTALGLQLTQAVDILAKDVAELVSVLESKAIEHKYTLMMGRTHGVHAEPTTFGLKMALWAEEMKRNAQRLAEARKNICVGKISGAVGTYATVPPEVERIACTKLGLAPAPVSSQIVQRDRHAQFVTTLAIAAGSLEKFATEIRGLQRTEVREVEEPFEAGQTGSSAMPHKRNPELCERICGLARLIRGHALTSLENISLWHERDISHSSTERIILPDSCLALDYMLSMFASIMKGLRVYPENMRHNIELTQGVIFSQRVLLALIDKGLAREEAYKIVQDNAMKAWEKRKAFLSLLEADKRVSHHLSRKELNSLFDYGYYTKHVDEVFRRLKLTKARRGKKAGNTESTRLAPTAV